MSKKLIGTNFDIDPQLPRGDDFYFGSETKGSDFVFLGRIAERRDYYRKAFFDVSQARVVAIVGKRGSGKSYSLGVLMEGLVSDTGQISSLVKKPAVILFDTLNIFWTCIYQPNSNMTHPSIQRQLTNLENWGLSPEKLSHTKILIPAGFKSNSTPEAATDFYIMTSEILPSDWAFLLDLDLFRDPMGQLLNTAYEKVVNDGWNHGNNNIPLKKNFGINDLIYCIINDNDINSRETGFHINVRRALISKFKSIQKYPLFTTRSTEISDLIRSGSLTILLLADLPSDIRSVIVSILFRKILSLRRESTLTKKREVVGEIEQSPETSEVPPLWLLIDEAQNIVPSESFAISSPSLIELVRVGRNYGISIAFTTQQPSAIDQRLMSQVDTLITHKLTVANDITKIVKNAKTASPENIKYGRQKLNETSLIRALPIGYSVISNDASIREFVIQVRERVTVHGGFEV